MSYAALEQVLGKVILNTVFRDALLSNPQQALSDFNLTNSEKNYLKRMDAETLDHLAALLLERDTQWRQGIASNLSERQAAQPYPQKSQINPVHQEEERTE